MESKNAIVYGTSKYRREQLKIGIDELRSSLDLSDKDMNLSQLQTLHYACKYILMDNKLKYLLNANFINKNTYMNESGIHTYKRLMGSQFDVTNSLFGFITILTRDGTLIYVSDNVYDYLKLSSTEVLLSCDKLHEILHPNDEQTIKSIFDTKEMQNGREHEIYCSWHTSKIKRKIHSKSEIKVIKMKGRFTANGQLFVALCTPMLRNENRDNLAIISPTFATLVCSGDLKILEICKRGQNILGYKSIEYAPLSLYSLLNTTDLELVRKRHKNLLNAKSKKGKTDLIRILEKNGRYIGCLINMYFSDTNHIICKLQFLSDGEMEQYKTYVSTVYDSNTEQTDACESLSTTDNLDDENDEQDIDYQMSTPVKNLKRRATDEDQYGSNSTQYSPAIKTESCISSTSFQFSSETKTNKYAKTELCAIPKVEFVDEHQDDYTNNLYQNPLTPLNAYHEICQLFGDPNAYCTHKFTSSYNNGNNYDGSCHNNKFYQKPAYVVINEESNGFSSYNNSPLPFDEFEMYENLRFIPDLTYDSNDSSVNSSPSDDLLDDIMSIIQSENLRHFSIPS